MQTCSDVTDGTAMSLQVADGTNALLAPMTDDACLTTDYVEIAGKTESTTILYCCGTVMIVLEE